MPQNADQMFSLGTSDAQGFSGVPVRRIYINRLATDRQRADRGLASDVRRFDLRRAGGISEAGDAGPIARYATFASTVICIVPR